MNKRTHIIIVLFIIIAGLTGSFYSFFHKPNEKKITIFQTADIHAYLDNKEGGILKLAELLKKEVKENGGYNHSLLIDCGDLLQGSYEGSETKGKIIIPIFNSMKYDIFIPGNHDFDFGQKAFIRNIDALNCNILAANLDIKGYDKKIYPWKMYLKNDKKIAVIGMTNPNLTYWLWGKRYEGIEVYPMEKKLMKIIPDILKEKPDLIILAVHQGLYQSKRYFKGSNLVNIAQKYPQIDIILGGHTHTEYSCKIIGRNTVYVQPGRHGEYLTKINVSFLDGEKDISSELISMKNIKHIRSDEGYSKMVDKLNSDKEKKVRITAISDGKLIADIMRKSADSDISFYSVSKSELKKNIVTVYDLYRLVPYEDNIVKLYLTFNQLRDVIQEQYDYYKIQSKYKIFNLSGINYKISKSGKITLIKEKKNKNDLYSIALSSYDLAGGGNRYLLLRSLMLSNSIKKTDTGILIRNAVYNYFKIYKRVKN